MDTSLEALLGGLMAGDYAGKCEDGKRLDERLTAEAEDQAERSGKIAICREYMPLYWNADVRGMARIDAERQFRLYRPDRSFRIRTNPRIPVNRLAMTTVSPASTVAGRGAYSEP
jgi:hypothetical protein